MSGRGKGGEVRVSDDSNNVVFLANTAEVIGAFRLLQNLHVYGVFSFLSLKL